MHKHRNLRALLLALLFLFIIALTVCFKLNLFQRGSADDPTTGSAVTVNQTFRLKKAKNSPSEPDIYPFSITVHSVLIEKELDDPDGYYEERPYISDKVRQLTDFRSIDIMYKEDIRYIVADITIERLTLSEEEKTYINDNPVVDLSNINISSKYDNDDFGDLGSTVDCKILDTGEDTVSLKTDSDGSFFAAIEEGKKARIQLVFVFGFNQLNTLYQPCLELFSSRPLGILALEHCYVNLPLELYESPYPISSACDTGLRSKKTSSVQAREAAAYKADSNNLNPSLDFSQFNEANYTSLTPPENWLLSGEAITVHDSYLDAKGQMDDTRKYKVFSDISCQLYDTQNELPDYFAESAALAKITERYVNEFGYDREDLKFLKIQFNVEGDPVYCLNFQTIWFYGQTAEGILSPYGNADDYQILEASDDTNLPHSPYLYMKEGGGDTGTVELVLILYPDKFEGLYFTPFTGPLEQSYIDELADMRCIEFYKLYDFTQPELP